MRTEKAMTDKWMETAKVLENREIAPGIFDLRLETEQIAAAARPGQFVSVYCDDASRILPRPISVCGAEGACLRLVYRTAGAGTKEFSRKQPGDTLRILGPLGNGYPLDAADGKTIVLTGGGIGIPPLLYAARALCERAKNGGAEGPARITAVLGYRSADLFLAEEFKAFGDVFVATEDGSAGTKGTILTCMEENGICPDMIFACGPAPMLRALQEKTARENTACWISLEERMACGVGACLSCVRGTREEDDHSKVHNARVCREGPVFEAGAVII